MDGSQWDVAINIGTNDNDDLLKYKLVYDFRHPIIQQLANPPAGAHLLTGHTALPAIDYMRSDIFTATGDWRDNDALGGSGFPEPGASLRRLFVGALLELAPLGAAIDQATSSVFFSIAFLYQAKSGPTREAIDRLMNKDVFSYGISDREGGLTVKKPDGSFGIVDFNYLAGITPMPFKAEWSGGSGIHEHHKFVVTDFNLPTAKVFTGSSNLSPSGEAGNGDNLVMIEDSRVATSYAIEALRVFDHLHFRTGMSDAFDRSKDDADPGRGEEAGASALAALTLKKPR